MDVSAAGSNQQAILGGSQATSDPQVFMLQITQNFSDHQNAVLCSATLVGSKSLLTAAHCLDKALAGADSLTVRATNVVDRSTALDSDYIAVTDMQLHPQWNAAAFANDFALALLDHAVAVPPKNWNSRPIDTYTGDDARIAGYGVTEQGTYGVKRQVAVSIAGVGSSRVVIDQTNGIGACHGDSGGPMFHVFDDGIERIIGVSSGGATVDGATSSDDCMTQGVYGRVDQQHDFILQWFQAHESPQCVQDGMCRTDCAIPDVDCACGADGFCSPDCPNLLDDPDCPRDCLKNAVCSEQSCPTPDPDCLPVGTECANDDQCQARLCINDAQNQSAYCSQECLRDADCPKGMTCNASGACIKAQLPTAELGEACTIGATLCLNHNACAAGKCVQPCANAINCSSDQSCTGIADGVRFCEAGTGAKTLGGAPHGSAKGCSAGGAPWWMLVALLPLLRRKCLGVNRA